jgi:hypothetical protein
MLVPALALLWGLSALLANLFVEEPDSTRDQAPEGSA